MHYPADTQNTENEDSLSVSEHWALKASSPHWYLLKQQQPAEQQQRGNNKKIKMKQTTVGMSNNLAWPKASERPLEWKG